MSWVLARVINPTCRLKPICVNVRHYGLLQDRILTDVNDKSGICTMRLNSPPVNTLDSNMLDVAIRAIKTAESMKEVRGIIVTSNLHGKVFSAGLNLTDLYQKPHNHVVEYWTLVQEWYLSWYGCSKPTVAVINGHALAGGCAWALMCDYRIMQADDQKTIGLTETMVGISAPFFMVDLVAHTLPRRSTELALMQALVFKPKEALKIGFVDEIAPLDNLMDKGEEQLQSFMSIPPRAYQLTKFLLRQKNIAKFPAMRKDDAKQFADQICQPEVQERIGMYLASLKSRTQK